MSYDCHLMYMHVWRLVTQQCFMETHALEHFTPTAICPLHHTILETLINIAWWQAVWRTVVLQLSFFGKHTKPSWLHGLWLKSKQFEQLTNQNHWIIIILGRCITIEPSRDSTERLIRIRCCQHHLLVWKAIRSPNQNNCIYNYFPGQQAWLQYCRYFSTSRVLI